jgi:hypothetical protein
LVNARDGTLHFKGQFDARLKTFNVAEITHINVLKISVSLLKAADSTIKAFLTITTLTVKLMALNRIMRKQVILKIKQQKIVFLYPHVSEFYWYFVPLYNLLKLHYKPGKLLSLVTNI